MVCAPVSAPFVLASDANLPRFHLMKRDHVIARAIELFSSSSVKSLARWYMKRLFMNSCALCRSGEKPRSVLLRWYCTRFAEYWACTPCLQKGVLASNKCLRLHVRKTVFFMSVELGLT